MHSCSGRFCCCDKNTLTHSNSVEKGLDFSASGSPDRNWKQPHHSWAGRRIYCTLAASSAALAQPPFFPLPQLNPSMCCHHVQGAFHLNSQSGQCHLTLAEPQPAWCENSLGLSFLVAPGCVSWQWSTDWYSGLLIQHISLAVTTTKKHKLGNFLKDFSWHFLGRDSHLRGLHAA